MAKRTAVIDLGSNSVRMVVFEKTSRFGFHLIKEVKSRVRLGEGAYERGGRLQQKSIQEAFEALEAFHRIATNLQCTKVLCVATSALRDAPNASDFTSKVRKELDFSVRIIDGHTEARYGGMATINLLPFLKEATTVDIGGGSTELAKIIKGKIVDTVSLNIGTVRLKELFFDTKQERNVLEAFLDTALKGLPSHFSSPCVVGIGGTLRALSNAIMEKEHYPLKTVHGFSYDVAQHQPWIETIGHQSILDLKPYGFKKDRIDTIREGCTIFSRLLTRLGASRVLTSGAGVREGVFLSDLLASHQGVFPKNFNPSLKSLIDRFSPNPKDDVHVAKTALALFDALAYLHKIDEKYKYELSLSAKLHSVGSSLSVYQEHLHSFYFIINNLNFGFSHEQKMLIALLTKYHTKKLPNYEDFGAYGALLPEANTVNWLSFILAFAKCLNTDLNKTPVTFSYENHTLHVKSGSSMRLAKEAIKKLIKPASFAIAFR